ncbi:replication protein [Desulforamulus aquiferis]|uniref:Replication protein n=1 Tax=Desulforamulus aquiferis TaxID=1397668 RepID=A0AAW7ZEQ8_9FIRM|nr:replication protein [Desulforamulus aquiferis]MDO7787893.1 replication protein [Desulforamulus aquiferis]
MANPQPSQFTRISNELYNAIMQTDFSKRQRNIIDLVIRMSYGCGKKTAILRPVDFELVGIYKTHIGRELDYLVQAKVLVMQGEQVALNKNYEEWRVSLVKNANQERFKALIKRNLGSYQNSNLKENFGEMEVTETVTKSYQNSNLEVTKTVTGQLPHPSDDKDSGTAERKVKDIKENIYTPPSPPIAIEDILARFPRYNNRQTDTLRNYWQMIGQAHKNRTIPPSIVAKEMDYWERFPAGIVMEAIEIHMRKYQSKQEDYTAGIMRRLVKEKGGSTNGTISQGHQTPTLDRSKFLWKGS